MINFKKIVAALVLISCTAIEINAGEYGLYGLMLDERLTKPMLDELITKGLDISGKEAEEVLDAAIHEKKYAMAQLLLDAGTNPDEALSFALISGDDAFAVGLLVANGAKIKYLDAQIQTATDKKKWELLKVLLHYSLTHDENLLPPLLIDLRLNMSHEKAPEEEFQTIVKDYKKAIKERYRYNEPINANNLEQEIENILSIYGKAAPGKVPLIEKYKSGLVGAIKNRLYNMVPAAIEYSKDQIERAVFSILILSELRARI